MLLEAKVKYNGNHYFAGQTVRGSKFKKKYVQNKGWTYWIFDDEPIKSFPYYGEGRDEWVEIDKSTLTEYREE